MKALNRHGDNKRVKVDRSNELCNPFPDLVIRSQG